MTASALPPRPRLLVGREHELALASEALLHEGRHGCAVVLTGPAGIGKSVLAAELAWRLHVRFPDGCAWVDAAPLAPRRVATHEIAAAILDALGMPMAEAQSASRAVEQARSSLRSTRVLVVIDGVEDAGQILDLMPKRGWRSAIIATSRTQLRLEAQQVVLAPLSPAESIELLRATTRDMPALSDPELYSEFARAADGQPLAIAIIGALIARNPSSAREVLHRLRNESTRSSFGEVESATAAVRGSLAATYGLLSPRDAGLLRLIGLLSSDRFTIKDLQRASGVDDEVLRRALGELTAVGLVDVDEDSCRVHPAVRRFAREQLGDEDIHSAAALLTRSHIDAPDLSALWLEAQAPDEIRRERSDRVEVQEYALRVAMERDDRRGTMMALANLGTLHAAARRLEDGAAALHAGLAIAERADDAAMVAQMAHSLGQIQHSRGMLDDALEHYELSVRSFKRAGDARGRERALISLGDLHVLRGLYRRAAESYEAALSEIQAGDHVNRGRVHGRLAHVADSLGQIDRARELYASALRSAHESSAHVEHAELVLGLALMEARASNLQRAWDLLTVALRIHLRAGSSRGAARAALGLGGLAAERGDWDEARERFEQAKELVESIDTQMAAYAAYGCAFVARMTGADANAISLLELALAHFREASDDFGEAHALRALAASLRACGDDAEAQAAQATAQALFERWDYQPQSVAGALHAMTLDDRGWGPGPDRGAGDDA